MHSIFMWPTLTVLAGAAICVPVVEDGSNRSILYWGFLPSLLLGAAFVFTHFAGF